MKRLLVDADPSGYPILAASLEIGKCAQCDGLPHALVFDDETEKFCVVCEEHSRPFSDLPVEKASFHLIPNQRGAVSVMFCGRVHTVSNDGRFKFGVPSDVAASIERRHKQ